MTSGRKNVRKKSAWTEENCEEEIAEETELQLQCMTVDNILPFCSPAPYGDIVTESTKLDPSVRRASEAWCDVALDYEYKPESERIRAIMAVAMGSPIRKSPPC